MHLSGRVDCEIALPPDEVHLRSQRWSGLPDQRWLVDHRAQVAVVRLLQGSVNLINPVQRLLNRTPGVEARTAGIGDGQPLSSNRLVEQPRPLGLQKVEVGHPTALAPSPG